MNRYLVDYYRCPEGYVQFNHRDAVQSEKGYFAFGSEGRYYGELSVDRPALTPDGNLCNVNVHVQTKNGTTYLPFDLTRIVDNLRLELYPNGACHNGGPLSSPWANLYYLARPVLPVGFRKHLQKIRLSGWKDLKFPRWPVDRSIDILFSQLLLTALTATGRKRIPFIWFWPKGAPGCVIMTHDVETAVGRDWCPAVMDLDDQYGIKSSFSIVPEQRYEVTSSYLDEIKHRDFEILIQDLNHDGRLFRDRKIYLERVQQINEYGRRFGANGFRSAVLYRNQTWFDALQFSYDTSVPNVAHLEPQRGGCCTVMPYFIGDILELPVTTTQDYALFNYLNAYSIDLWKHQIDLILEQHGLINFIIHPDYVTRAREWRVFESLLSHIARLREDKGLWIATSGQVDQWWRQRAKMRLLEVDGRFVVEGDGSKRARVAYATEDEGRLRFEFE